MKKLYELIMIKYAPFEEIKNNYIGTKIPYVVKLTTIEWKLKRDIVSNRENNICEICGEKCMDDWLLKTENGFAKEVPATYEFIIEDKEHYDLSGEIDFIYPIETIRLIEQKQVRISNVHHKYYVLEKEPWEYPNEDLMLLCHHCHKTIHQNQQIKIYKDFSKNEWDIVRPCQKCCGTGYLWEYSYWQGGICFDCNGKRFLNWG
jgi:hypothetical protein